MIKEIDVDELIGKVVTVIIFIRGKISISIQGQLRSVGDFYHIPGNPAIKFELSDIESVELEDSIIRLKT